MNLQVKTIMKLCHNTHERYYKNVLRLTAVCTFSCWYNAIHQVELCVESVESIHRKLSIWRSYNNSPNYYQTYVYKLSVVIHSQTIKMYATKTSYNVNQLWSVQFCCSNLKSKTYFFAFLLLSNVTQFQFLQFHSLSSSNPCPDTCSLWSDEQYRDNLSSKLKPSAKQPKTWLLTLSCL